MEGLEKRLSFVSVCTETDNRNGEAARVHRHSAPAGLGNSLCLPKYSPSSPASLWETRGDEEQSKATSPYANVCSHKQGIQRDPSFPESRWIEHKMNPSKAAADADLKTAQK